MYIKYYFTTDMFTNNKEFYSILEIDENSDLDTIKAAYKRLSFKWHPDKNINNKEVSEDKFKSISEAYQVLSNPKKKKLYDLGLDYSSMPENYESMFANSHNFVSNIFNFNFQEDNNRPIQITKKISLEEAYSGTEIKIKYKLNKICKYCNGIGLQNINDISNCNLCNGTGKINNFNEVFPGIVNSMSKTCVQCNGLGKISKDNMCCVNCRGKQIIYTEDTISFNIPPGILSDHVFVIENKGDFNPKSRDIGSLNIKIKILENNQYKRIGNHLLIEKDILLSDALCCSEFGIDHITLGKIMYSTNKIITPNSFRVINNLGMPILEKKGKYGHLIIKFNVIFPEILSEKRKLYLKKLLPISGTNNFVYNKNKRIFNSVSLSKNQNEELYKKIYLQNNEKKNHFSNTPVECAQM